MNKLDELLKIQKDIITSLKKMSFNEIVEIDDEKFIDLDENYINYEIIINKSCNKDGSFQIRVRVVNNKPPELTDSLKKLMESISLPITMGPSCFTDGFDVYPNGKIIPMHDETAPP